MAERSNTMIFDGVCFTIVPDDEEDEKRKQRHIDTLVSKGATYVDWAEHTQLPLTELSHIISEHVDFSEYQAALDHNIPTVKPSWISDSVVKSRQVTPRQYSPDPSQFFHDVIVTCGELPECDQDAIIAGVIALGGQHSVPMTKIVTHVVTTSIDHEKCKIVADKGLPTRIVLPHWFDHCLRLGKKINEKPYELPNAEILRRSNDLDPVRAQVAPEVHGASASRPEASVDISLTASPSKSRKSLSAFRGKSLYIGEDLQISQHLKSTLADLVTAAGGSMSQTLEATDIYVGHYRESNEFVDAFVGEKVVGSLSWLYNVLNTNRWTNPETKLLHYPVPKYGIPGFRDHKISVSNYSGDARTYVQNLVKECGAIFTKTMRQENTHLVTAHKNSEKCEAAKEWNINMVNHLWLEESYARCAVQTLTNPRYTTFPSRTNLGEIVGHVSIDIERIEQVYIRPRLKHRETDQPVKPVARRLFEVNTDKTDSAIEASALVSTPRPQVSEASKPANTPQVGSDGKENQSPFVSSTGLRASKMKAIGALHSAADDIAQFQKEMKRKGGVIHGGKRESDETTEVKSKQSRGTKRPSDASYEETTDVVLSFGSTQPAEKAVKKAKLDTGELPPISTRLLLTGDNRWASATKKASDDKNKLRELGVSITAEPSNADIIVAPKILRTRKFLVAVAHAPVIVGLDYLNHALETGELPAKPSLLSDKASEEMWDFKLSEALRRAKVNKNKLFRGWEIYVSDKLVGGFDTYKDVIVANGGVALVFRGSRRGITLKARRLDDPEAGAESQNQGEATEAEAGTVYFVAGDTPAEKPLWKQFSELAIQQDLLPRIMKPDWLLTAALSQHIRYKSEWEWE